MSRKNNDNGVIELFGHTFKEVKYGLDEEQIVSFVKQLIDERDALIKRQEHVTSLTRLYERTISEADDLAEEIKKEAEEQAQAGAKAILGEAEEQAQRIIEEKESEAVALAQKEVEVLLKREIAAIQSQLRDAAQRLCDEMLSQAESFKQQAAVFEEKFEGKLSELEMVTSQVSVEDSQVIADTDIPVASEAMVRVGEVDQLCTSKAQAKADAGNPEESAAECKEWVVLEILPPRDQGEIESIVAYLNGLDEVATVNLKYFTDKTVIEVALDKSINLVKTLSQLPQVEEVQEVIENKQKKIQIVLCVKAEVDRARNALNQMVNRIVSGS
jgi:cell division septum initiation protein DivIVA